MKRRLSEEVQIKRVHNNNKSSKASRIKIRETSFKTLDLLSLDRQNNLYKYDSKKKHVYELKLAIISLGRLYALLPLLALC